MKTGFDNALYLQEQSEEILKRAKAFDNKLYLEFGGKLSYDYHAARILPGFDPNVKLQLLQRLKDKIDVVICIYSGDIERKKIRADFGIAYDADTLLIIDNLREWGVNVKAVVVTRYDDHPAVNHFINRLERRGVRVYKHRTIKGYPADVDLIVSDSGYGANEYIESDKPIVVVTGPGPSSGKMATCLSQVYHEHRRGVAAGYAKFETFPVWNLPLNHPVNIAYEAATADIGDVNMIDPFHLEAYQKMAVNYNRDIAVFPVVRRICERIMKPEQCYKSPTDMGVNMAGNCICDDEACREASRQEIIRRYYAALNALLKGDASEKEAEKIELLMNMEGITVSDRKVAVKALERAQETGGPAAALELEDGRIITGKTSNLLGASAALLVNVLKELAGIDHNVHIISPEAIEPIQKLKVDYLNSKNPRLHTDEILIALSASAAVNPIAELALSQLPKLKGCQAHTSVMLSSVDIKTFKKLGVQLTSEAVNERQLLG